ncbi:MAG: ankyrin repeat domain-containing protein [Bacteroidales bacterium]|nr:ankyrin repeat domain-containing protein [Bacteroidales bacterium]
MKVKNPENFFFPFIWLLIALSLFISPAFSVLRPPYLGNNNYNLLEAVYNESLEDIERHLKQGADPDTTDFIGTTALMLAAIYGNEEITDLLLEYNADVNLADIEGMTTLLYALLYSNEPIAAKLLPLVDEIDQQNADGFTALIFISQTDNISFAQYAVERGANVNHTNRYGVTPLMYAAAFGNFYMIDLLHFHGADINHQSDDGSAAIHMAAYYGQEEIMGLLLELGADIDLKDNKGNTPLMYAVMAQNPAAVWYLMESGANAAIISNNDFTPLSIAVSKNDTDIVDILTAYDFVEPDPAEKRNTLLARAYYSGTSEMVEILKDFSGTKPKGLYVSELSTGAGIEFNSNEQMFAFNVRLFESRFRILTTASFATRSGARAVQVYQNPDLLYQFQELRNIWSLVLQRELFSVSARRARLNFYLGFKTLYSHGSYAGTAIIPPAGFSLAPALDFIYRYQNFSFNGGYYFYRTGQTGIPPNRFQVGIQYHFQLFKSRGLQFSPIIR